MREKTEDEDMKKVGKAGETDGNGQKSPKEWTEDRKRTEI